MDLIIHITLRPYYPQSNGLTECMVKTIKILLREAPDIYLTLFITFKLQSYVLPYHGAN